MDSLSDLLGQYGFPIVASIGMANVIFYVWSWTTNKVDPILHETRTTLISLIDNIRVLENDILKLEVKIKVASELKNNIKE
jgi:hypothetical protein